MFCNEINKMALKMSSICPRLLLRKFVKEASLLRSSSTVASTSQPQRETPSLGKIPSSSKTSWDKQFMCMLSKEDVKENNALFSALTSGRKLYITDQTISSYIPLKLGKAVESDNCAVAIMYPGPGPLTSEVLRSNAKNLFLFEPHSEFRTKLKEELQDRKSQNIVISSEKFYHICDTSYTYTGELYQLLTSSKFSSIKIISSVVSSANARQIVLYYTNGAYQETCKNIELYLVANNLTADILDTRKPPLRRTRAYWIWFLWRYFMKSTKIATFSPVCEKKASNEMALFKCTFQSWPFDCHMPSFQITPKERKMISLFVKYFFNDPNALVIASLEKISPRIGLLILRRLEYFNLHTKFYQLSPEELIIIYDIFRRVNLDNNYVWKLFDDDWDPRAS